LSIKPGKPSIVGIVDKKLVLGLPGHPVSAMVVYDQLIRMYLEGMTEVSLNKKSGVLSQNIHAAPGKETFVMVKIEENKVIPILGKSGMISLMSQADGYIRISANDEGLVKGENVVVYLLD
jgi:molybdopterin molybdotransferase